MSAECHVCGWDLPYDLECVRCRLVADRDAALARARDAEQAHMHALEAASRIRDERDRLRATIDEYRLWEPGRAGHAAAHRRLMEALSEQQHAERRTA